MVIELQQHHPRHTEMGRPILVWCSSVTDGEVIVPIEDIKNLVLCSKTILDGENVLVTIPQI